MLMSMLASTIASLESVAQEQNKNEKPKLLAAGIALSAYIYGTLMKVTHNNIVSATLHVSFS